MKHIKDFSVVESRAFIDSFDHFLFDCDGVLYLAYKLLPKVGDTLNRLKSLNKKIRLVTNNSTEPMSKYIKIFKDVDVEIHDTDITTPYLSLDNFFKSIKFNKKIYVIGSPNTQSFFEQLGYQIYHHEQDKYTNFKEFLLSTQKVTDIGALVVDFDVHLNYLKLMVAKELLNDKNVLFLSLMQDKEIPITSTFSLIGPGHIIDMLKSISGREATNFGKPDAPMKKYLLDNLHITDPSRVLFIGDSLDSDMVFADLCKFKKLLMLSGVTQLKNLENITDSAKTPDYYADGMEDLFDLLNKIEK